MKATIAAVATAAVLAGCGGNTDMTATTTVTTTPTTSATPTALGPGLVPGGWGDVPPDHRAIDAMWRWAAVSIADVNATLTNTTHVMETTFRTAEAKGDVNAMKAACQQISKQITRKLPAHMPTPDPDLTHALRSLVAEAKSFATNCNALLARARSNDLQSLSEALLTLRYYMGATGAIMNRDVQLLTTGGR